VQDGQFELTIQRSAGAARGDILTEVNGTRIVEPDSLEKVMRVLRVGDKVHIVAIRETKTVTFDVVVEERPVMPFDLPGRRLGGLLGAGAATAGPKRTGVIVF